MPGLGQGAAPVGAQGACMLVQRVCALYCCRAGGDVFRSCICGGWPSTEECSPEGDSEFIDQDADRIR